MTKVNESLMYEKIQARAKEQNVNVNSLVNMTAVSRESCLALLVDNRSNIRLKNFLKITRFLGFTDKEIHEMIGLESNYELSEQGFYQKVVDVKDGYNVTFDKLSKLTGIKNSSLSSWYNRAWKTVLVASIINFNNEIQNAFQTA